MNELQMLNLIGMIDEKYIEESFRINVRKVWIHRYILVACAALLFFSLSFLGIHRFGIKSADVSEIATGGNSLIGKDGSYPTIKTEFGYYEWHFGKAIIARSEGEALKVLDNLEFYGEFTHSTEKYPTKDNELCCWFDVKGYIYIDPDDQSVIYLYLSTDWMNDVVVTFDRL